MTADSTAGNDGNDDIRGNDDIGDDEGSSAIEADDVAWLNTRAVERAGAFTRLAGTALVVVGVLGAATWAWLTVRQQQRLDDVGGQFELRGADPSLTDRIDAFAEFVLFLVWAGLAVGAGVGLRLAAHYTVVRAGGSVTGFAVGDPVPDGGLANDPQTIEVDPFNG
jgi:hypothetical protein